MPPTTDDLAAASDELRRAWLHGDAGALDALIDDDATINWFGAESAKESLVEAVRTGRLAIADWETVRERVRVLGELGRIDELARIEWVESGAPLVRITATWQLTDQWRLVSSHATSADPRALASWA